MVVESGARTREEKLRQEEVNEGKTSNVEACLNQKHAEQNSLQLFQPRHRISKTFNYTREQHKDNTKKTYTTNVKLALLGPG